jgi:hypothetical protein
MGIPRPVNTRIAQLNCMYMYHTYGYEHERMLSAVTLPRGGRWARYGQPRGIASTVPRKFVLARLAAACLAWPNNPLLPAAAVAPDCLAEPTGLSWQSRWTAGGLSCDFHDGLSCGGGGCCAGLSCGARRTVLIVPLDTRRTVLWCPRRTVLRRRWRGIRYTCTWDIGFWIWV